jgi:hypothetical protein
VGTTLGEAGVNIARMQLALHPKGHQALQLLNVDPLPPEDVVASLRALPEVVSVELADLGPGVS